MSQIGYIPDERRDTETEKSLQVRFLDKESDPYAGEIGKHVFLYLGDSAIPGIYRGITVNGSAILFPSLVKEFTPEYVSNWNAGRTLFRKEDERPQYILTSSIRAVSPITKEYFDRIAANYTLEDERKREQSFSDGGGI